MNMKLVLLLLTPIFLLSQVHFAKVEPLETTTIKSSVSGLVLEVKLDLEAKMVKNERVIYLEDKLDNVNLSTSKETLVILQEMLKLNQEVAVSLKSTLNRQENYYHRMNKLSTTSKSQKDKAFKSFASAKTQYLGTKEKILSLSKQILEIKYKISQLKDTINKKSVVLKEKYLSKIMVREGDFVNMGTALIKFFDMTKARLVLYFDKDELQDLENKIVYINDKKSEYRINKLWKITDDKYISSYRAEIYIHSPKGLFSKLVKVEIK